MSRLRNGREPPPCAKGRSALLLLPGLACDGDVWDGVLRALGEQARCVVPLYSEERSLDAMAERVLAMAPPIFGLVGHSMGGRVALEVVRRAPERVERLALLDTGYRPLAKGSAGADERARRYALLALARKRGMRAMAEDWVRPMVHPSRLVDRNLIEAIVAMIARQSPAQYEGQIEALLARPDATALLRTIGCPTLVLCGREDAWSTLDQHEEMAALIPAARLSVVESCGHMAPMERPEAVAAALGAWLRAVSGAESERVHSSVHD